MQPRQFVPPLFVLALSFLTMFSVFTLPVRLALAGVLSLYGLAASGCSLSLWLSNENCAFPVLLAAFPILHLSYGSGFLYGLIKFRKKWRQAETFVPTPLWQRAPAGYTV